MKCIECGGTMNTSVENYAYEACGLPGITLEGVEVSRCKECGAHEVAIPNIEGLHEALALVIISKSPRLTTKEVRFLRKHLGYSSKDFAVIMGVTLETVSRWESGANPIGGTAERLLRVVVAHTQPQDRYPIDNLRRIDLDEPRPVRVRLARNGTNTSWDSVSQASAT